MTIKLTITTNYRYFTVAGNFVTSMGVLYFCTTLGVSGVVISNCDGLCLYFSEPFENHTCLSMNTFRHLDVSFRSTRLSDQYSFTYVE